MENAVEALKMAFAVLVFVIAMSLAFMLITQARSTADVVFTTTDKQEYVEGYTSIGQVPGEDFRTVGIDTIIPVIYRYHIENYGVTILDSDYRNIIALYDIEVENKISNIPATFWRPSSPNGPTSPLYPIYEKFNAYYGAVTEMATGSRLTLDENNLKGQFSRLYSVEDTVSCPWTSSDYNILRRIKVDLTGTEDNFGDRSSSRSYQGIYPGAGFISQYGDRIFKEYYYNETDTNNLTGDDETVKLQIIYVLQR